MIFKRVYLYHIVYNFKNKLGSGFGSVTITRNKKIKTPDDVQGVKQFIENEYDMDNVIIFNWTRVSGKSEVNPNE